MRSRVLNYLGLLDLRILEAHSFMYFESSRVPCKPRSYRAIVKVIWKGHSNRERKRDAESNELAFGDAKRSRLIN